MRRKIIDKLVSTVTIVAAILIMFQPTIYATKNYAWSGTTTINGESFTVPNKCKRDSTSCYVNYSKGNNEYVTVRILARQKKNSGTWVDVTYPYDTIYMVSKSVSSFVEVKNLAYEKYGNNSKKKCFAKLKVLVNNPDTVSGYWRANKS